MQFQIWRENRTLSKHEFFLPLLVESRGERGEKLHVVRRIILPCKMQMQISLRVDLDSVRKLRRREKLSGHCQQQEDEKKLSKCLRADVQHVIADAVVCPTRRHFESFNACLLLLFRGRQTRNNIFTSLHNCAFSLTTSV
jgi:hypothetical protein